MTSPCPLLPISSEDKEKKKINKVETQAICLGEIFFIRHGETVWNQLGIVQGHAESSLTNVGRIQAQVLGRHLQNIRFDHVYTSDLERTVDTCLEILKENKMLLHNDPFSSKTLHSESEIRYNKQDSNIVLTVKNDLSLPVHEGKKYLHDDAVTFKEIGKLDKRLREIYQGCRQGKPIEMTYEKAMALAIQESQSKSQEQSQEEVEVEERRTNYNFNIDHQYRKKKQFESLERETRPEVIERGLDIILEMVTKMVEKARTEILGRDQDKSLDKNEKWGEELTTSDKTKEEFSRVKVNKNNSNILLVSHGGFIRYMLSAFLVQNGTCENEDVALEMYRKISNTSVSRMAVYTYPHSLLHHQQEIESGLKSTLTSNLKSEEDMKSHEEDQLGLPSKSDDDLRSSSENNFEIEKKNFIHNLWKERKIWLVPKVINDITHLVKEQSKMMKEKEEIGGKEMEKGNSPAINLLTKSTF